MLAEQMGKQYEDDTERIRSLFPDVRLLHIGSQYYLSSLPQAVALLSEKYTIDWRDELWQR